MSILREEFPHLHLSQRHVIFAALRKYLVIKYMQKVCADLYQQFGTAGNASKSKQVSLEDYATKYAKGKLAQVAKKTVGI